MTHTVVGRMSGRGGTAGNGATGEARIVELDEIDSTNAEALRRAFAGESGPLWILSRRQTAGRGRLGRGWTTIDGNLAASLLFTPMCPAGVLFHLSFVAAVAVHDALCACCPELAADEAPASDAATAGASHLRLKWPNDLMVGHAKLGGILIESSTFEGRQVAVVGIGINIVASPTVPGRATTALASHCRNIMTPDTLVRAIARSIDHRLAEWACGAGFASIRTAWTRRGGPLGEMVTIDTGARAVSGRFAGLDDDGALLLRVADGVVERFTAGDVSPAFCNGREDGNGREEE